MADTVPNSPVFDLDDDGLLKNPAQWNETVAREIARQLDIAELTDEHWEVIRALREHYAKIRRRAGDEQCLPPARPRPALGARPVPQLPERLARGRPAEPGRRGQVLPERYITKPCGGTAGYG